MFVSNFLKRYKKQEFIFLLFFVFLIVSVLNPYRLEYFVKFLILPISIVILVFPNLLKEWIIWLLTSIFLALNLYFNYLHTSNHLFIATYFSWIVTLILISKDDFEEALRISSKYLLVLVMGMALIHKITSPEFYSGNFISYEYLLGLRSFFPIMLLWPNFNIYIEENRSIFAEIVSKNFDDENVYTVVYPGEEFFIFTKILSYLTIFYEAIVTIFLLIYPRYRRLTHILLISFIWFTYIYTNENSFFSMLCILGYVISYEDQKKFRALYILTIILMLSMDVISFRPGFLEY